MTVNPKSVAFLEIVAGTATTNNVYVYNKDWQKVT